MLAAGHGAVLAIAAAAAAWDMRSSSAALIDVLVPTAGGRARHQGLRIHRRPDLHPDETTHLGPIPITTPARTLFDLAARLRNRRSSERWSAPRRSGSSTTPSSPPYSPAALRILGHASSPPSRSTTSRT